MSAPARLIYVMERDGLLKIGCSRDPRRRARDLNATLIGAVPGTFTDERWLHDALAAYNVAGEWFRDTGPVREMAESWRNLPWEPVEKNHPSWSHEVVRPGVYNMTNTATRLGMTYARLRRQLATNADEAGHRSFIAVGGVPRARRPHRWPVADQRRGAGRRPSRGGSGMTLAPLVVVAAVLALLVLVLGPAVADLLATAGEVAR